MNCLFFRINEIEEMICFVKEIKEDVIVFVDNCYGEFVEEWEFCYVGVDFMVGFLIKNLGGGFVKMGGYFVGKVKWIEVCFYWMILLGIGSEVGVLFYLL